MALSHCICELYSRWQDSRFEVPKMSSISSASDLVIAKF
jgi:hypothetical protein